MQANRLVNIGPLRIILLDDLGSELCLKLNVDSWSYRGDRIRFICLQPIEFLAEDSGPRLTIHSMSYHESWLFQHSFRRFKAHERVVELGSTSVEVLNVLLELLVAAHDYLHRSSSNG